jgi:hypothetical protein
MVARDTGSHDATSRTVSRGPGSSCTTNAPNGYDDKGAKIRSDQDNNPHFPVKDDPP